MLDQLLDLLKTVDEVEVDVTVSYDEETVLCFFVYVSTETQATAVANLICPPYEVKLSIN